MMVLDMRPLRPVFSLILRDVAKADDAPAAVRLRRVIKALLRHYSFALVELKPAPGPGKGDSR
jgi:hypothetical protein